MKPSCGGCGSNRISSKNTLIAGKCTKTVCVLILLATHSECCVFVVFHCQSALCYFGVRFLL